MNKCKKKKRENKGVGEFTRQSTLNAIKGKENIIILDTKGHLVEEMLKNSRGKIVQFDLSKSKHGWFNPFTGESSRINELKEKANKAKKDKNYRKAYKLLSKVKQWEKKFRKYNNE